MSDQKKYTSKLTASRILIIGGSSGIGFSVAEACIEHGAHVVLSSSNPTRVESAVSRLNCSYPSKTSSIHGLTVDLGRPSTLEKELENVLQSSVETLRGKKLNHVILTAGDALATLPLSAMTYETIVAAGQVRFFAPLLLAKFLPRYLETCSGSSYTITTGSISEKPMPDWSVVAGYAGGIHSVVRNLALDLKPVRVNGVSPGVVDTELWQVGEGEREGVMKSMGEKLATGRVGRPEDVAESYLGLLRDGNVSGSMVRTDGGGLIM